MLTDLDVVKDLELVPEGDVHPLLVPVARARLWRDVNDRRILPLPGSALLTADEASAGRRRRSFPPEWRSCRKWHSKHTVRSQILCCDGDLMFLVMAVGHHVVKANRRNVVV